VADWAELNIGKASNNKLFREGIQERKRRISQRKKGKKSAEIWNTSLRHNGKQEDACKEKEEERKAHDHLFNEW